MPDPNVDADAGPDADAAADPGREVIGGAGSDGATAAPPALLRLSEVRKLTGIDVNTLRLLIDDKVLRRGVERASNGHVYMRADAVPAYADLVALIEQQVRHHLEAARKHLRRIEVEIEAVRNDIELAAEDVDAPLGHDLVTLRARSNDPRASSLTSALSDLEWASWTVRSYHDALAAAKAVSPSQTN